MTLITCYPHKATDSDMHTAHRKDTLQQRSHFEIPTEVHLILHISHENARSIVSSENLRDITLVKNPGLGHKIVLELSSH